MRILACITARGGSKRLPGKNIRLLGGKPLMMWSIDVARDIADVCDILVSTDDSGIAKIAIDGGALVPWLRPPELATDTATSVDVCLHALDWYEAEKGEVDGLMLLQPTSPFRSRETVLRGIELFRKNQYRYVISVSPAKSHPMWCFRLEGNYLQAFIEGEGINVRSQDLPLAFTINGGFYLIAPDDLRKQKSFYSKNMLPLVIDDSEESIDIDTESDWKVAESIYASTIKKS